MPFKSSVDVKNNQMVRRTRLPGLSGIELEPMFRNGPTHSVAGIDAGRRR
jgi:hypothetical protein